MALLAGSGDVSVIRLSSVAFPAVAAVDLAVAEERAALVRGCEPPLFVISTTITMTAAAIPASKRAPARRELGSEAGGWIPGSVLAPRLGVGVSSAPSRTAGTGG